jgi:hypothetical protein
VVVGAPNSPLRQGFINNEYDFGFAPGPTGVTVGSPSAVAGDIAILVRWQSFNEINILGYNIYRSQDLFSTPTKINTELIKAEQAGTRYGSGYEFSDGTATANLLHFYWLEVIKMDGTTELLTPAAAGIITSNKVYLPAMMR